MKIAYFVVCMLVLLIASYTDLKKGRILNETFYPVIALSLSVPFVAGFWPFLMRLGLVILVFFAYDGFFGAGDAKLIMMLIMLGSPMKAAIASLIGVLGALIYSFIANPQETKASLTTGIIAIKTHIIKEIKGKGNTIAFAPFLTAGFVAASIICGI